MSIIEIIMRNTREYVINSKLIIHNNDRRYTYAFCNGKP